MNLLDNKLKVYYAITLKGFENQMEAARTAISIQDEFSIPDQDIFITGILEPGKNKEQPNERTMESNEPND